MLEYKDIEWDVRNAISSAYHLGYEAGLDEGERRTRAVIARDQAARSESDDRASMIGEKALTVTGSVRPEERRP